MKNEARHCSKNSKAKEEIEFVRSKNNRLEKTVVQNRKELKESSSVVNDF